MVNVLVNVDIGSYFFGNVPKFYDTWYFILTQDHSGLCENIVYRGGYRLLLSLVINQVLKHHLAR